MREGRERQTLRPWGIRTARSHVIEGKRPNKELASIAAPQARETEEYTGPMAQDPDKQPAECPSRKSALLLGSNNFMSSRFQVKSLLLLYKDHKSRDCQHVT